MWRAARRALRFLAWLILSTVLLVLVATMTLILWARSRSGRELLKATITSTLQRHLDGRVTLAALDGDLTRTVILRDLRIYDRDRRLAAAFAEIHLDYELAGLVRRTVRIRSLTADGELIARRSGGTVNLVELLRRRPPAPPPSGADASASRWRVEVAAAHVRLAAVADVPTAEPLRGALTLDASATVRGRDYDVELRQLRGDLEGPLRATLAGTGGVHGAGGLPLFRDLRLVVQARALASPAALVGASTLTLVAHGHEATLLVETPGGALRAHADAAADATGRVTWTATASSSGFDPGALFARAPHGRIDLAVHAAGQRGTAAIVVDRFRFDVAGTLASARGRIDLGRGLQLDVAAELQSPDLSPLAAPFGIELRGGLRADVRAHKSATAASVAATLHARDLAVAGAHAARVDARVAMQGLAGRATLRLRDATVALPLLGGATAHVRSFSLVLDGDGRELAAVVEAEVANGSRLRLVGHAVPLHDERAHAVALRITELAVVGHTQRWRLTEPAELRVGRRLLAARLSLAAGPRALRVDGELRTAPAHVDLRVHAHRLALDALAGAVLVDPSLPATEIDLDAHLRGRPSAPRLDGRVEARTSPWPAYDLPGITAALDASIDEGRLSARLQAASPGEQLRARVEAWSRPDGGRHVDGELALDGLRLAHVAPLLPGALRTLTGRASATARLSGTATLPALTGHVALSHWQLAGGHAHETALDVTYRDARLDAVVEAHALQPGRDSLSVRAQLPVELMLTTPMRARVLVAERLRVTLRGRDLDLGPLARGAFGAAAPLRRGRAEVALDLGGSVAAPTGDLHVELHDLAVAEVDDGRLRVDGSLRERHGEAVVHGFVHGTPVATARVEATLDALRLADPRTRATTPLSLMATVDASDLAPLHRFTGSARAHVELVGTLAAPRLSAVLRARDLGGFGMSFSAVDADARWDGDALAAALHATQPSGGALQLAARIPRRRDEPVDARLQLRHLQLAVDRAGRLRHLEGAAEADVQVSGSRAAPLAHGFVQLADGAVAFGAASRPYRDVTLDVRLDGRTLELRRLAAAADGGTLAAHGRLTLDEQLRPAAVELVADAGRFPLPPANAAAWVDAHVQLHGRAAGDRFDGELSVTRGRARLPAREAGRTLQATRPLEDVVFVDDSTGSPTAVTRGLKQRAESLDVTVLAHIPGPFRVDSDELHAELRGELELRAVGGDVRLYGEAEAQRGRFELLNRPYEIERARVSFDGDLDPRVDVRLTRELPKAKIIIAVHGTAKAPELELTSDPPIYDESQIIGLVISGDPGTQQVEARSTEQQVVGAISDVLVGRVLDQLAPGLPIDVIRLDTGASANRLAGFAASRLEVGKYIRDNIYVSYIHRFGATLENTHGNNRHEANVEYRFRRRFALGMRYGDAGIGAVELSWSLRF